MKDSNRRQPWTRSIEDIVEAFKASPDEGLDTQEAKKRKRTAGPNRIEQRKRRSAWGILLDQFKNLIVLLLAVAAGLSFSFGQWLEGLSITAAIFINAAIGFITELKAIRSMEALKQMSRVRTRVLRDGSTREIPAEDLVPGDLVVFEGGDIVSADLRILEASRLKADESALTGESVPVPKHTGLVAGDVSLAERKNMLFKGTFITHGSGKGVVTATGMDTKLGGVAAMAEEAEAEQTPLEKRLNRLAYRLIWITLMIAGFVAASGMIAGTKPFLIIETSIALAVAAIPEGLPIVATVALARGMWRMAGRNAVMNRLSAVETLGATSVICTDKTGTLTENRMTVSRIALSGDKDRWITMDNEAERESTFQTDDKASGGADLADAFREILEIGVLCNNAELKDENGKTVENAVGDPLEVALLAAGAKIGLERKRMLESQPEVREEAFDADTKMMATFHEIRDGYRVAVKGAPEAVIAASTRARTQTQNGGSDNSVSDEDRKRWQQLNREMAETGLRVIATAARTVSNASEDPYKDLTFIGLIGMSDPPRPGIKDAIEKCRNAGIRVIMVTGDQPQTAAHIGISVGLVDKGQPDVVQGQILQPKDRLSEDRRENLLETEIFARVSPKQKLNLIELHQSNCSVVAMTGDGVNDAPALKKADIGIAMGKRGTQVAREAADMVLKDDAFQTIVVAVAQGRAIFDNIRKFILFLLSGNMGEIMIVAFALLAGAPLPLLPLQILYLNMIGDVFPALALGVGTGDESKMKQSPRDAGEPILTPRHWKAIVGYGLLIALPVLGSFALALNMLEMALKSAVTVSFLTLAFARLWHVFNMRDTGSRILRNDVTRNPFVWGALALCVLLLLMAAYVPVLSGILKMTSPGVHGWSLIIGMSLVPLIIGQSLKALKII